MPASDYQQRQIDDLQVSVARLVETVNHMQTQMDRVTLLTEKNSTTIQKALGGLAVLGILGGTFVGMFVLMWQSGIEALATLINGKER